MLATSLRPMSPHPALARQPRELAHLFTDWDGLVPADGILAEEKRDGIRALYIDGRLFTREGNEIHGVAHILSVLRLMEERAGFALFIDAEFQVGDSLRDTISHFRRGAAAPDQGTLWAFDCMSMDDWRMDSSDEPLFRRKAMLLALWDEAVTHASSAWEWPASTRGRPIQRDAVIVLPDIWLIDGDAVWDEARRVWARNGEGLVLKTWDSLYRRRRTRVWQKVKNAKHSPAALNDWQAARP